VNASNDTPYFAQQDAADPNTSAEDMLVQFDDDAIERALRTVSCNARDMVNYLRSTRAQ